MALKVHKLTDTGDIELDNMAQATDLLGKVAAEQMIVAAISLWKGNFFVDPERGVDWLRILKKKFTRVEIVQVFTQAIQKLDIVDEVLDLFINVGDNENPELARTAQMTYLIIVDGGKVDGSITL